MINNNQIYLLLQEKQKLKVKEKLDKYNKEKLLEFCDLFDMPIGKTSAKKVCLVFISFFHNFFLITLIKYYVCTANSKMLS